MIGPCIGPWWWTVATRGSKDVKRGEEIRYYALKTTAAGSTFIIGWIFIIKNPSSWLTAEEYLGLAARAEQCSLGWCVCVCACMDTIATMLFEGCWQCKYQMIRHVLQPYCNTRTHTHYHTHRQAGRHTHTVAQAPWVKNEKYNTVQNPLEWWIFNA